MSAFFDPFAEIPGVEPRPEGERPELERKGARIPLTGEKRRAKKPDYESLSREHWRARGYVYHRCQQFVQTFHGGAHAGGVFVDLFGCVDAIAIGPEGEIVFVQTSSLGQKPEKKRKVMRDTFGGTGKKIPILEVVSRIAAGHARYVICLWDQPGGFGTKWACTEIDVTSDLLAKWTETEQTLQARRAG